MNGTDRSTDPADRATRRPEPARRTIDARPPIDADGDPAARGRRWFFDVARDGGESSLEARLQFAGPDRLPPGMKLLLIDRTLERTVDLERQHEYRFVAPRRGFVAGAAEARFELRLGTEEFTRAAGPVDRPRITRLLPIFPNPVVSNATVRFELARPGPVVLSLYDILGREVRTLLRSDLDAGVHEVQVPATDERGRRIAPGVYTLRLVAPDRTAVRKLVRAG